MPSWRQVLTAVADAWERARGRDPRLGRADRRSVWRAPRSSSPRRSRSRPACSTRPSAAACDLRHPQRRLRRRAQVPAGVRDRVPAAPRRDRDDRRHPARDGLGRHVRPDRRRLRALLGRRALARAPLREDALRQRAARARLPARLAGHGRPAASGACARRRSSGRCARCARRRAASSRRSTPTPRARRAASTSGRPRSCARCWATTRQRPPSTSACIPGGNFEGRTILTRGADEPDGLERDPGADVRGARRARVAGPRRQAPHLLERADDRRAGRGRRGPRARRLPGRRAGLRRVRAARPARRATAGCCAPSRTARPS